MEITEFEKKRAANLIWNGAMDYSIKPGFRVFDEEGHADIYWNSIVGVIHKHYNWAKLQNFYNTFHETVDQGLYESFFWLALENAAYLREMQERPVLPYLRKEYAQRKLSHMFFTESRAEWVLQGHLRHALGEDSGLPDLVDRKILEELELGPELDTDQIIEKLGETLSRYFTYRMPGQPAEKRSERISLNPLAFFRRKAKGKSTVPLTPVRRLAFGYGEHVNEYGSAVLDQSHLSVAFASYSAQTDEGLREYITTFFGKSLYSQKEIAKLERKYCCDNHADVHLHITRGEAGEDKGTAGEKNYAKEMHKRLDEQYKANLRSYEANVLRNRITLDKLTAGIRNSVIMYLDEQQVRGVSGRIETARVWRGAKLDDNRIFSRTQRGDQGNVTVDILLDASTSQIHRQESLAAQGYMIAEALTRCQIPVKVYSFCSMNGYMIVNLYRDYEEHQKNREIFRYAAAGANRDGLAIRLSAGMMEDNHAEHRLLIVLSDCKPNDMIKVRNADGAYFDYAGDIGVEDAAAQVHSARMQGIHVMCVFTGDDADLSSVKRIYGKSFARIKSLDMFADTVGNMIREEIRFL